MKFTRIGIYRKHGNETLFCPWPWRRGKGVGCVLLSTGQTFPTVRAAKSSLRQQTGVKQYALRSLLGLGVAQITDHRYTVVIIGVDFIALQLKPIRSLSKESFSFVDYVVVEANPELKRDIESIKGAVSLLGSDSFVGAWALYKQASKVLEEAGEEYGILTVDEYGSPVDFSEFESNS